MPKLGAYMDDVVLSEWLVGEGEQVAPGRAIFELETEKTTAEVESETAGFVHHLVAVGQTVPIGSPVALIAQTHEEYQALTASPAVSPRARALLKELGLGPDAAAAIAGTGPGGRLLDRDRDRAAARDQRRGCDRDGRRRRRAGCNGRRPALVRGDRRAHRRARRART